MKSSKLILLLGGVFILLATECASPVHADVDVNVGINIPLPVYVAPAPPPVVVIPNSYVYYVPDIAVDILFYHGYWYRPHSGHWYRSGSYNGPWGYMEPHRVPAALVGLPPAYRHTPPGHRHIPYGQLKKNWSRWEKERYWHHHNWDNDYRHGKPVKVKAHKEKDKGRRFDDGGPGKNRERHKDHGKRDGHDRYDGNGGPKGHGHGKGH